MHEDILTYMGELQNTLGVGARLYVCRCMPYSRRLNPWGAPGKALMNKPFLCSGIYVHAIVIMFA